LHHRLGGAETLAGVGTEAGAAVAEELLGEARVAAAERRKGESRSA
jgi:hypothetical protein